ncbi:MAG TPA: hypothetical protein VKB88_21485 [Bryobacteraceae bacterium]|nr:hypothetical protein [Bryobacteraceae bacterium]
MPTTDYAEGFTPCAEVTRWKRRFWISATLNIILVAVLLLAIK